MTTDLTPRRSGLYHRRSESVWHLLALRRLQRRKWTDGEIALALSDLSVSNIVLMEKHNLWSDEDVDGARMPGAGGPPWTRQQVRYYRRKLKLTGAKGRYRHECGSPFHHQQVKVNQHAARLGWGHLTPLTPGELKLIESLATEGSGTRKDLEERTGLLLDASRCGRRSPLRRLQDRSILAIVQLQPVPVYGLAKGVHRYERTPHLTSIEMLAQRLGWLAS
jgi:hypothetical protein